MDFAVDATKDESSVQNNDQGYRTSLSTGCKKRGGKRRGHFRPPVNNKRLKAEMEDIKTDSTILENGLPTDNSEIKEDILQELEMMENGESDGKNISPMAKNDGEQDDKNSENIETIKTCPLNFISDNIVKSLDSIFFPEYANDNENFSSLQNDRKSQLEQQHISPSPKKNVFKMLEANVADTYNLLEKERGDDQTIINGSTEKEKNLLIKTAISPLCERSEQNEMKEQTDKDEKSVLTKINTITLDNENKDDDENNITETKNIYLKEQEKSVKLECHANVKDFADDENKIDTSTIQHANFDNTENFKNECINIRKNTKLQDTGLVKETSDEVSLYQRSNSPALIDELLNDIKQAAAIVNILSNGSDKENCTANGDITNIQFLKDITITSLDKDNEKRNLEENCNEDGNGLANCTDCKNECDHSNFNGTYKYPKQDQNTLVENSLVNDKIDESGSNVFQEEVSKQMIDTMDSMNKSLAPQEKKLTLFYINALDYDKEILTNDADDLKTNMETKDYEKHAQFLNDSVNINTVSFEMKRVEINMQDVNENALNKSNSLAISSTKTDQHLLRDKDELETSEKNDFQLQNLCNRNTENVITKKTIIHDQDCIKSVCSDQNQRDSDVNITHCVPSDKENKFSVSCDTQQSEILTTKPSYIIKDVSSTVSLAENSNSGSKYSKISLDNNATGEKLEKAGDCFKKKCLKIPEMSLLVTATDYFKVEKVKNIEILNETENSAIESIDNAYISPGQSDDKENLKENYTTCLDAEDSFDMDDDFDLTASQLSMIEVDERNHTKILNQEKENSSEETTKCANTHFNSDSVTVDIMDQLCYIRESVESIKELLSMLLKAK